jgi:hypothetical protein
MLRERFHEIVEAVRRACLTEYGERLISLAVFGSIARGTMRPDSDIDLLLVVDPLPQGRIARVREFEAIEAKVADTIERTQREGIHTILSPVIRTPAEVSQGSPLFLDMTDQAWILYDQSHFLRDYLDALSARLAVLGAKRIHSGGSYYWLLKPDFKPGEEVPL